MTIGNGGRALRWPCVHVNALGANQREHSLRLAAVEAKVDDLGGQMAGFGGQMADTNARVRSLEEGQAEIKDLLIRALDR